MTTNKLTEGAETLNKNVNDAMKWFQDTTSTIMMVQSKQLEYANEMYSKMMNNYLGEIKKDNFNDSFDLSKKMMDLMQKNIESFIKTSGDAMKTIMESGNYGEDPTPYSKEMLNKMTKNFNEQVDMITNVNKNTFDTLSKQFNISKTSFSPTFEKSKKEFEANFKLSKETIQKIVDSYAKLKTPTLEANKKVVDDLNKNMNSMAQNNFKLWSELLNKYDGSGSKSDSGLLKKQPHHSGNGKVKTSEMK
ncbi:MAG: hypothetical protein A3F72_02455 [Bacteroidetes bacterium RIFCSPLOWO2_12_FULL_35_15]|nr:MAG: hypothetical protein A3F72_02455 [Bacteroidetes bacterium RIFCSPLOWO2_12_FULL_35_15]